MKNKKIKRKIIEILILLLSLILLVRIISFTYSRYESKTSTTTDIDVALYVLRADYTTMNINLDSIVPRNQEYVYTFSVSNTNGTDICETDMKYDLSIKATTNLPITYELYKNQNYNSTGATNIIESDNIEIDEYGTYFRNMKTETENFTYNVSKTNIYQLVMKFPEQYNTIDFQDIIEGIKICIDSKQIVS